MTNSEKKLLIHFLGETGDVLSNNVCNDFDLKEFMPSSVERDRFVKDFHYWNGDPENATSGYSISSEEYNSLEDYRLADFCVVALLRDKLKNEVY